MPRLAVWLFLALNACDVLVTYLLVQVFGTDIEGNPLMRQLMKGEGGWILVILMKIVAVIWVLCFLYMIEARKPKLARRLLHFACIVLGCVILYSLSMFLFLV